MLKITASRDGDGDGDVQMLIRALEREATKQFQNEATARGSKPLKLTHVVLASGPVPVGAIESFEFVVEWEKVDPLA